MCDETYKNVSPTPFEV